METSISDMEWVERPWGRYLTVSQTPTMWVKSLTINPWARLSLQKHEAREEFWHAPEGRLKFTIGDEILDADAGVVYHVPCGVVHRIENVSRHELSMVEVAFGAPDESDIIRLEDDYGRK